MPRQFKVEMLGAKLRMPISQKPDGVQVGGLHTDAFNGPAPDNAVLYFVVEIVKDVAVGVFSAWLYDYVKQFSPKRTRINGREPADRAEFDRIIADELEIGKND